MGRAAYCLVAASPAQDLTSKQQLQQALQFAGNFCNITIIFIIKAFLQVNFCLGLVTMCVYLFVF